MMPTLHGKLARAMPRAAAVLLAWAALHADAARACVGDECLLTWSTAAEGGALTLQYDFANARIPTFYAFCGMQTCLYGAADPGFMNTGENPPAGSFVLAPNTTIRVEIVAVDPGAAMKINDATLDVAGESASLGTTPELHTHPSWQLRLPPGEQGDYAISFKLTTNSTRYAESEVFSVVLTNLPTPTPDAPTPTASPTPTSAPVLPACAGDCDDNGVVTVNEIILGVASAIDGEIRCAACDRDGSGTVTIGELIGAVSAALAGCPAAPTPTATVAALFANIRDTILTPRCAITNCHTSQAMAGTLVLDADNAYAQLVDVPPFIPTGPEYKRVDPFSPETSFLLVKLEGPPPGQGTRMPQTGPPLSAAEMQLIRDWIAGGAQP